MIIINKIAVTCLKKRFIYPFQFRLFSGISSWDEELSSKIKHHIEDYWAEKTWSPNYDKNEASKEKFYVLSMFPYPSGKLHMGHVRVYTISDTVARFQRMNGKNVFHPIGWDAFGLPAENAAIEHNISPQSWTKENITQMKQQLKRLGCSFDWDRELATCNSDYYKWTQYIFLKLYEAGLVYQKEALVNWDPVDKTVLAHEQVDENGFSWRSGAKIEKKLLKQWFIRTTKFAKDLLDGLNDPQLQDWRDIIKLQKHWIGECNGVTFDFKIIGEGINDKLSVWTDKPELITNAKFIAVKEGTKLTKHDYEIVNNVKKLKVNAENPLTGELLPIFVTNEIEYELFTDTYLGIPNVCESDKDFATSVNIPMSTVNNNIDKTELEKIQKQICKKAQQLNAGGYWTSAKLQDWLISRQRYWGTPIPMIHCESCGIQPVPEEELPVLLPSKLNEKETWLNTSCPKCGSNAKRESDTMDTFVDSAWYFFRYIDSKNDKELFRKELAQKLTPVDLYIGGKEHAVLHLYYARFMSHFLHSLGLIPKKEPFKRLLVQGMIMGQSYRIKGTGKYVHESEVKIIDKKKKKAVHKTTNELVVIAWEKMSKSKHNGVDPDEMFSTYGVDTTRLLVLADVAPTSQRNWQPATFPGIINWQHRLWLTVSNFIKQRKNLPKDTLTEKEFREHEYKLFDSRNYYIKGTTFNYYTSQQMSVAVSKLQGLTNSLRRAPPSIVAKSLQFERALAVQIIMMAPMAPHFASELWSGFQSAPNRISGNKNDFEWDKNVLEQTWPEVDLNYSLDLVCDVNGIESAVLKIPRHELEQMDYRTAVDLALQQSKIQKQLEEREVVNIKFNIYKGYEGQVHILARKKQAKERIIS